MASLSPKRVLRCMLALCAPVYFAPLAVAGDLVFEDGFEVDLAAAFFVSPQGLNSNPGTMALPFQTISKGVAAAAADAMNRTVIVALAPSTKAFRSSMA